VRYASNGRVNVGDLPQRRVTLAAAVLAAGMLVSFLLPWERFAAIKHTAFLGIESPPAVLAAVAICAAVVWSTRGSSAETLALSAAAVLLIGAAVSGVTLGAVHSYGAWVGLGFGIAFPVVQSSGCGQRHACSRRPLSDGALPAVAEELLSDGERSRPLCGPLSDDERMGDALGIDGGHVVASVALTSAAWVMPHSCHICGISMCVARVRISTTVDERLLATARRTRSGLADAALIDEALGALLARHRRVEIDAAYAAYDRVPLDVDDEWGSLASFRTAAGAS